MAISYDLAREESLAGYRKALATAWKHKGDHNVWPIKLNGAIHLFVKEFGEEFLEDLVRLEQSGRTLFEIAQRFGTPSRLFRLIDFLIYSMRRNRYSIHSQREVVIKLLRMTKSLKSGSPFNEDGCNRILAPQAVRETASAVLKLPLASPQESQLVHRFCGVMWAYTESLFFRAHDIAKEIHGPYCEPEMPDDQILVKEYFNLRPLHLWTSVPMLPNRRIRVVQQYTSGVLFQIDAFNHVSQSAGSLQKNLQRFVVEIDGKPQEMSVLKEYVAMATESISAVARQLDTMSWQDRAKQYAEIFWLRKKPLSDELDLERSLPQAVRERIENGSEFKAREISLSAEASERLAMLTI